jgi:hypothetical protein
MHDCGLYSVEDMRPINETRMAARWKLGKALAKVERAQGDRTSERGFTKFIAELGLTKPTARDAERLGCMPDEEMARLFEEARKEQRLLHYGELIVRARPWWYQENRVANLFGHQAKLLALRKWCDANHRSRAKSSPLS